MSIFQVIKKYWVVIILIVITNSVLMTLINNLMVKFNVNKSIQALVLIFGNFSLLCLFIYLAITIEKTIKGKHE